MKTNKKITIFSLSLLAVSSLLFTVFVKNELNNGNTFQENVIVKNNGMISQYFGYSKNNFVYNFYSNFIEFPKVKDRASFMFSNDFNKSKIYYHIANKNPVISYEPNDNEISKAYFNNFKSFIDKKDPTFLINDSVKKVDINDVYTGESQINFAVTFNKNMSEKDIYFYLNNLFIDNKKYEDEIKKEFEFISFIEDEKTYDHLKNDYTNYLNIFFNIDKNHIVIRGFPFNEHKKNSYRTIYNIK